MMKNNNNEALSKALASYEPFYERILKTGSRVICSPPPEDTDEDYLALCTQEGRHELEIRLQADGWMLGGSLPNGVQVQPNLGVQNGFGENTFQPDFTLNTKHEYRSGVIDQTRLFHSWKRVESPGFANGSSEDILVEYIPGSGPEINLLVTCNEEYFNDFTRATFLCKGLNLLDKEDRVMVFEALTCDVWPIKRKKPKYLFKELEKYGRPTWMNGIPMTSMEVMHLQDMHNIVHPPMTPEEFSTGPGAVNFVQQPW